MAKTVLAKAVRLSGSVLTPQGFVNGTLTIAEDGRISGVSGQSVDVKTVREAGLPIIMPGFVDLPPSSVTAEHSPQ